MGTTVLAIISIAVPVAFLIVPAFTEASILSFVANIFNAEAATTNTDTAVNSQKMSLLEAPVNTNVNAGAFSNSDIFVEGDALVAAGPLLSGKSPAAVLPSNKITTYKVKSGDTISDIADTFGISANTILWANNLKRTSTLTVGKTLVILPISGVQHKVASGDTIGSIAKKYKGNADEILSYNDLTADKLKIGDIVVIPDGELASASTLASKSKSSAISKLASISLGVGVAKADTIDGYYMRPILSGYRTQGLHGNNGVDLANSCGTPIYASAAGTVLISESDGGWNGGYGNYIVISHDNGSQTLYSHMQDTTVAVGARIERGQAIGTIGATGKVDGPTGCHVHFEIRNGPVNPF